MKITRDNYESWFLDYLEGRLEEGRMDEFIRFVSENPDLKEELKGFEPVTLNPPEAVFPGKEKLHKALFDLPEVFDQMATARMEGDLDSTEALRFEEYLQRHPGKRQEADLFRLTRLVPDPQIVFPRKAALYHRPVIRLMMTWTMRVAAVLLVAALIYTILEKPPVIPEPGTEVAVTTPETPGIGTESGNPSDGLPRNSTPVHPEKRLVAGNKPGESVASGNKRTDSQVPGNAGTSTATYGAGITRSREVAPALIPLKEAALEVASAPVILASVTPATTSPKPAEESLHADTKTGYRPLNEVLMEKTGLDDLRKRVDNLSISKLTRFGLRVAATVSNDKFSVDTNNDGEIIAYNLDTRLLGLSIPVKKD